MSYAQFGYTYQTSSQLLMTGQSSCCDNNQNGMASDHTVPSPTVCSLPTAYDSRILSTYPRLATGLTVNGLYGSTYADQAGYVAALGSHHPPLYSTLSSPYDLKDGRTWPTLPQAAAACYSYDPTALAGYGSYGERYDAMDSAARRKNATRETTNTLKAWLYEHRKNPYPTKGEKIMLAIITKMTLTQVSTWFANARRRLKKENKMTWEPKNKTGDMADSDDKSDGVQSDEEPSPEKEEVKPTVQSDRPIGIESKPMDPSKLVEGLSTREENGSMPRLVPMAVPNCQMTLDTYGGTSTPPITKLSSETDKPKIWSLAQTAISDTGPPNRKMAFDVPPVNSDPNYTERTPSGSPCSTSGCWTTSSLRSVDQTSDVGAIQSSPFEDDSRLPSVPTVNPANLEYSSRLQLEDGDGENGSIRTHSHYSKYAISSDIKNPPRSLLRFPSSHHAFDYSLTTGANRNGAIGWCFNSQREKDLIKDTKPYVAPNQVPVTTGDTTAFKPVTRSDQPLL